MMMTRRSRSIPTLALTVYAAFCATAAAQDHLLSGEPGSFRPAEGWRSVAEVSAVPGKTELITGGKGGIMVNGNTKGEAAPFLFTRDEFGDVHIELEFMVPKDSNAGVYVMGRYEVQIYDSFGRQRVGSGDLGAIYQRWDPALPKDRQGFEGSPPKVNAAKAPGEWQTLEVFFRAPRFDAAGKKTGDATFEKVLVNGVLVQENASTSGPTRSAPLEGDAARGPIAIQGDHGPIAIRRFRAAPIDTGEASRLAELDAYWAEVSRAVREGDFEAYQTTCHAEGVLVSGAKQISQPLATALERWKQEFLDTRDGKITADVRFRISKRLGDATTAHESGIFRYVSQAPGSLPKQEYIHFEGLLVKRRDGWKMLMENQKGPATEAEWEALK